MNGTERKRVTLLEPSSEPLSKKQRVATSTTPSSDDERESPFGIEHDTNLENFRKEAIFRGMEEYRRKFERAQRTIESLEKERARCEARLSAVDVSWSLLVQEADLLLPSTSTAPNGHSHSALSPSVSDPSLTDEELEEALAQRSSATKALLGRLHSLHPTDSTSTEKVEELQESARKLLESSIHSQEALRLLRTKHESTIQQLEFTHSELARAEKRLDRLQSVTVAKMEGRATPLSTKQNSPMPDVGPVPNGMNERRDDPPGRMGPDNSVEMGELKALLASRAQDIEELRHERVTLKMDLDALKAKLVELPDEIVAESVPFRLLQGHVQQLTSEYDARKLELDRITKEADGMREMQESFREMVFREAADQVEEVQKKLLVKENDLTRIRSQREDFRAESTELRAKESEKVRNLDQLKTLVGSREERIAAYSSEVRRLKMQIAAANGDSTTVDLLGAAEEEDIIQDLQKRLRIAEDLLLALRDQLRAYTSCGPFDGATIAKSETEARKELSQCQTRLAKLDSILGPEGNVEVAQLVEQVQGQEAKLKVLEAQLKSQEYSTNMLYGEIDRLSAAWSTLDEQNSSKVFNLVSLEEKVQRLNTEKAKADNRYFATMRQKDAIAAENAVLSKLAEKQQRAVDSATDLQHSLGIQLAAAEKEITLHQKNVRAHQDAITSLKRENTELTLRNEQNVKHITELNSLLADRISQAESEMAARKRTEEQVARMDRELKLAKVQSSTPANDSSQLRELKKYNDDLSKMLKCSTCSLRFKGVIINRCGHLFCKECIDARLSNRARKCPTCGLAFGKDDVSSVYF